MALASVPSSSPSFYNHLRHVANPSAGGSNISFNTIKNKVHGGTFAFSYYRGASFRRVRLYNNWTYGPGGVTPNGGLPTVRTTSPTTVTSGTSQLANVYSKSFRNGSYTGTINCNISYSSNVIQDFFGWYAAAGGSTFLSGSQTLSFSVSNFTSNYNWYGYVVIFGGSCTPTGTKISMAEGPDKNVEDLVPGDVLKSANVPGVPDTNVQDFKRTDLYDWDSGSNEAESWTDWSLTTARLVNIEAIDVDELISINDGQLKCTPQHTLMMYSERLNLDGSRGWCMRPASCLMEGDYILQQNGTGIEVAKTERIHATEENPITVYDINVEDDDFYWTDGFMSHNKK